VDALQQEVALLKEPLATMVTNMSKENESLLRENKRLL